MKITIIGATSFLARTLIKQLKSADSSIEIITMGRSGCDLVFDHPKKGLLFTEIDLWIEVDVIIYCAGSGIQPQHMDDDSQIKGLNYEEPKRLIDLLNLQQYCGQLITFGSYFELGNGDYHTPQPESEFCQHSNLMPNVYCESKNQLTRYINQCLKQGENTYRHVHLILDNIYGVGENQKRLLPYISSQIKINRSIEMTSGEQIRQFTHIRDIAKIISDKIIGSTQSGIFNIASSDIYSIKELVQLSCKHANFSESKLQFSKVDRRDISMKYLALDTTRFKTVFGEHSFISFEKGWDEYL